MTCNITFLHCTHLFVLCMTIKQAHPSTWKKDLINSSIEVINWGHKDGIEGREGGWGRRMTIQAMNEIRLWIKTLLNINLSRRNCGISFNKTYNTSYKTVVTDHSYNNKWWQLYRCLKREIEPNAAVQIMWSVILNKSNLSIMIDSNRFHSIKSLFTQKTNLQNTPI